VLARNGWSKMKSAGAYEQAVLPAVAERRITGIRHTHTHTHHAGVCSANTIRCADKSSEVRAD
jgi:hypothetical protein